MGHRGAAGHLLPPGPGPRPLLRRRARADPLDRRRGLADHPRRGGRGRRVVRRRPRRARRPGRPTRRDPSVSRPVRGGGPRQPRAGRAAGPSRYPHPRRLRRIARIPRPRPLRGRRRLVPPVGPRAKRRAGRTAPADSGAAQRIGAGRGRDRDRDRLLGWGERRGGPGGAIARRGAGAPRCRGRRPRASPGWAGTGPTGPLRHLERGRASRGHRRRRPVARADPPTGAGGRPSLPAPRRTRRRGWEAGRGFGSRSPRARPPHVSRWRGARGRR